MACGCWCGCCFIGCGLFSLCLFLSTLITTVSHLDCALLLGRLRAYVVNDLMLSRSLSTFGLISNVTPLTLGQQPCIESRTDCT